MLDIEKNILKRKYSFSKIIRAPGYPVMNFYMHAGPYSDNPTDPVNFRIVTDEEINDPTKQDDLFDTFTVRGGSPFFFYSIFKI